MANNTQKEVDSITDTLTDFPDRDFEHFSDVGALYDNDNLMHSFHDAERMNLVHSDSFLGIGGNKKKRGERKLRKAEKQLAKGHTKKAERKLGKAQKLLGEVAKAQGQAIDTENLRATVDANQNAISAMSTRETESPNTNPGQIGAMAGQTSLSAQAPQAAAPVSSGGGGGGGEDSMLAGGYYPDPTNAPQDLTGGTGETSTPDNPTTLSGVTVANKPKSKFPILYVVIGVVVLVAIFYFMRKKK